MNTQKTYDKQTAAFVAALTQQIPELSSYEMKYLIEHPYEIMERTRFLHPSLREFLWRDGYESRFELIELSPYWDFLIMRSEEYPELGIAVSDRSRLLGDGLRMMFFNGSGQEVFIAPSGDSDWCDQLCPLYPDRVGIEEKARSLIKEACDQRGITHLILHNWFDCMEQAPEGSDFLTLVDPYSKDEMEGLDKKRFLSAFGKFSFMGENWEIKNICRLFKE